MGEKSILDNISEVKKMSISDNDVLVVKMSKSLPQNTMIKLSTNLKQQFLNIGFNIKVLVLPDSMDFEIIENGNNRNVVMVENRYIEE